MINKRKLYKILIICVIITCCAAKNNARNTTQNASLDGVSLKNISSNLSHEINITAHEELGVHFIEKIYRNFKYTPVVKGIDKILKKITSKLEAKLNETFVLLNQTKETIEKYKLNNLSSFHTELVPCGNETNVESDFDDVLSISKVLWKYIEFAKKSKGAIKQSYYLPLMDVLNTSYIPNFKCKMNEFLLWKTYISHVSIAPKNIMLLLPSALTINEKSFQIMKNFAKQVITVLNKKDRIGIVVFCDDWCSPYNVDQCYFTNQGLYIKNLLPISNATEQNKNILYRFIDSLPRKNGTVNYTLGFEQAFEAIKLSNISSTENIMLLYVNQGIASIHEVKSILEITADSLYEIDNKVLINICTIVNDNFSSQQQQLLVDIAEQNYTKYEVQDFKYPIKGISLPLLYSDNIGITIMRFINTLLLEPPSEFSNFQVSLPTWDSVAKDLTVSITVPCGNMPNYSILGTDLYFSNVVEDITYFNNYADYIYAFIVNNEGVTVMHPSYPRPMAVTKQLKFVDIFHLEKHPNFTVVKELLLTENEGSYVLNQANDSIRYTWKKVLNVYTVCVVTRENQDLPTRPYKVRWFSINKDLVHHRLDIVPASNLCRHLNQVATLDAGSLYLSASSFQSPYSYFHMRTNISPLSIQRYMAYFKDNTHLISKPDLREEVRDDVAALAHILDYLRNQHLTGAKAMYVVRRYVAAPSGVLQLFPGSSISMGFEPTKRTWYLRAVEHKHRTILTPPYLDEGGAGYIVTIAYATSQIVTAMDVTYGYIYKLLLEQMPFCGERNIKCFMMDDRGYLIYHQNLVDPNGHGPIEQQHIIHKESLVANDILNRNNFVTKTVCNNYADGTIQRYYKLNLNMQSILENTVHGEQCIKYQITAVNGTNVFVGVVNASCELFATFCPCSMVDRLCLNCNRMEQKECECPCECPLNLDLPFLSSKNKSDNPLCPPSPEQNLKITNQIVPKTDLKSCFPTVCEQQISFESCLGVIGCEWCQIDADGETLLAHPFCSPLLTCFNGVLGSPTPYGDPTRGFSSITDDFFESTYSPVGAVIGSVIGVGLVLVLLFFCYRCHSSSGGDRFYFTSTQENQVQTSDRNNSEDYHELDNQQHKLLQDNKKSEPISPYYVSTSYRRPVTTADSDYGYSTMTPHDESEHLSLAPVEIDSLEDDTSDATSINTSVSSKVSKVPRKNKQILQFTALKDRNCIIAPVTVHRNMETVE